MVIDTDEEAILQALKAVSYTHLDVYKRQEVTGNIQREIVII